MVLDRLGVEAGNVNQEIRETDFIRSQMPRLFSCRCRQGFGVSMVQQTLSNLIQTSIFFEFGTRIAGVYYYTLLR
jgi:hypothetical protein